MRVFHSRWNIKTEPDEPKQLGTELLCNMSFFRLGENEEFTEQIINVIENRDVENSLYRIDGTLESGIFPNPNDLWEIEGFFNAFADIAFTDKYNLDLRIVAIRIITVLTIFDQENGCIFESEDFLRAVVSLYDLRNAPILKFVNNLLFNLLRDSEIASNVTECLFSINFLPHLHSLMVAALDTRPFKALLDALAEFASVFLPCAASYNEGAAPGSAVDTGVLAPFVPLLAAQMRTNGPCMEGASRLLVAFAADPSLARAVAESPLMAHLGAFFGERGCGDGFPDALRAYNAAVEAGASPDGVDRDRLVRLAIASIADSAAESGPAVRLLDDVVRGGEWFLLGGGRVEQLIGSAREGSLQARRRVAFLLARALSEAYAAGDRPRWRHSALRLVLETLPALGPGRARVVLAAVEEWAGADTGALSAAGEDTDIVDALEGLAEADDEDVAAIASRLLENGIFGE